MPRRPAEPTLFAGRYQIEQELGRGGFGTVHRAWDTQAQRRVALKIVDRRSLELAGGMHRFHREASVLMRLTHPNVVRAYDAGEWEGTPYLVLELLEGVSLETALRTRGPIPADKVVAITRDLLGALAEAHALGVVHRDVKPANVFLTSVGGEEGTQGTQGTRLLDFGIAKADGMDAAQTAMGATLGTAAYMAPEQITGGKVQPATDLFAVGLLMAEMIVGRRIYGGTSGLAILVAKANGAPVELPAAVKDSSFGPIVARAVQIDPERRFGSATEMRALLERAEGVRVSTAPRASFTSQPPRDSPLPLSPGISSSLPGAVPGAVSGDGAGSNAQATQPSALDATTPQPVLPSAPPAKAYVPAHIGDTAASAMAAPGPTQMQEMGAAETASYEPLTSATSPPAPPQASQTPPLAPRSRSRLAILAVVALILVVGGAITTWALWPAPKRKTRGAKTTEIDPDKPLVLEDGKIHMILPGDKPTTMGGITISAGDSPPREVYACADLETLRAPEVETRLRTLGKVKVSQLGETISEWSVPDPHDEDGTDVTLFELASTELAREAARRLRRSGPILVGGKRVVTVDSELVLPSVKKVLCRA